MTENKPKKCYNVKRNGIKVAVQHIPKRSLPHLTLEFEGEPVIYNIAKFTDEKTAEWFVEVMKEFFA
jgi:hypothetical protein